MSGPLRVVHYVNQFFGGIGGEDQAHVGVTAKAGPVGPGRALETALGDGARVEATLIGGGKLVSGPGGEAPAGGTRPPPRMQAHRLAPCPAGTLGGARLPLC